jgi:type II secretory pathway pseudopilin PulG
MNSPKRAEQGYSLVEVLISMGLLAGVMVAVCSMFVLGGTYVKAGRQLTTATTLAQDVMEDINKQSYTGLYLLMQGASPDPNAQSVVSDTRTSGSVADGLWGNSIRSKLHKGYAVVTLVPVGGSSTPPTFTSGEAIRVDVRMGWTELRRDRTVKVQSIRF